MVGAMELTRATSAPLAAERRSASFQAKRFIERDCNRHHPTGRMNLQRIQTPNWGGAAAGLRLGSLWKDPFHTVIHSSTSKILLFFCASYGFTHMVFSLIYLVIDNSCDLQIESLLDAMYLSLEVGMTIGWGLPGSPYMKLKGSRHGCYSGALVIYLHTLVMHIQNAMLIGLVYCRVARGTNRASSLVFSQRAVIREIRGKFYLMFQVCESRKHQLVEAKIRCYALVSRSLAALGAEGAGAAGASATLEHFENRPMRLLQPDDSLGSSLHLAVPSLVIHEIDCWSPLCPEAKRAPFPSPLLRAENPSGASASSGSSTSSLTREDIEEHLRETYLEVVVLVEGYEAITSSVTQGRQSYVNEDLAFDCSFAPCVMRATDGSLAVDFQRFQDLVPTPPE